MLAASAAGKLTSQAPVVEMLARKLGFQASTVPMLGALELACAVIFAVPRTAVLGAVGWVASLLREPRLRALLPLVR